MTGAFYYIYKFFIVPVIHLSLFLSPFIVFGFLIRFLKNRLDTLLIDDFGRIPYLIFAAVGTPIHELSHLVSAWFFRHQIRRFSLFSPNANGRLGFVEHAYDSHSVWQRTGCFFVGIAPIVAGTAIILLLIRLFLPHFDYPYLQCLPAVTDIPTPGGLGRFLQAVSSDVMGLCSSFTTQLFAKPWWQGAILFFLAVAIGSHMFPSRDDFKGMVPGLLLLYGFVCLGHFLLSFFQIKLNTIMAFYLPIASFSVCLLLGVSLLIFAGFLILWALSALKNLVVRR